MLTRPGKNKTRQRVHDRIRKKVMGTAERPRLNVYRSLNHIYAQLVNDLEGVTITSASTAEGKKSDRRTGGNVAAAKTVGKTIGMSRLPRPLVKPSQTGPRPKES